MANRVFKRSERKRKVLPSLLVGFVLSKINFERDSVFTAAVEQVRRVLLNRQLEEKSLGLKVCLHVPYHCSVKVSQRVLQPFCPSKCPSPLNFDRHGDGTEMVCLNKPLRFFYSKRLCLRLLHGTLIVRETRPMKCFSIFRQDLCVSLSVSDREGQGH